jgi:hypothetical protein
MQAQCGLAVNTPCDFAEAWPVGQRGYIKVVVRFGQHANDLYLQGNEPILLLAQDQAKQHVTSPLI